MENSSPESNDLRSELRSDAERVATAATERLETEADSRKAEAAEQAKEISSALKSAADDLGPKSANWIKTALEQSARTLNQIAQSVEQKDARQLFDDAQRLAREHPGTFLAGCAAAGLAAVRILKAGAASSQAGPRAQAYEPYSSDAMSDTKPAMNFPAREAAFASSPTTGGPT